MQNVFENSLLEHRVCLPPGAMGKITYVAEHGNYDITDKVLEVEFQGQKKTFTMMHVSLKAGQHCPTPVVIQHNHMASCEPKFVLSIVGLNTAPL